MNTTTETIKKATSITLLSIVLLFVLLILVMIFTHVQDPVIATVAMFLYWILSFLGLSLIMLEVTGKKKNRMKQVLTLSFKGNI